MQRACIHTTCSECNISDLAILLRSWNFASGSMAVASCIVTSCLLTMRNSIATVSIIHTTLMCGQMRIPTPLWKATFNYVLVSNVWCAVLDDQLIGPFILEVCLTGEAYFRFLQEELPRLLEDVPLNKRGRMYFQHDGASPHSTREVRNFLNYGPWAMDRTWRSPQLASQVSRLKRTGLLCMGMDERTGLHCEGGNARCMAWSHFGYRRPHEKQSAEATTSNSRSSQPSGSLCCGRRWHFRKPALSTDQLKLKVISRSYITFIL